MPDDPSAVFDDIRETALCLATRGKTGNGDFAALQDGVSFIRPFMFKSKYYIEEAIIDSAKAAYLATAIEAGAESICRYDFTSPELPSTISSRVKRLKTILPEAYFYWAQTGLLLSASH